MEATERLGWATGQVEASGQKSAFRRATGEITCGGGSKPAWQEAADVTVRIRNFGFLANRRRSKVLPLCPELIAASPNSSSSAVKPGNTTSDPAIVGSFWHGCALLCDGTLPS